MPLSVIEPGLQTRQASLLLEPRVPTYLPTLQLMHDSAVESVEYLPSSHVVQLVARGLSPVSVIEPAGHSLQPSAPFAAPLLPYVPGKHGVHSLLAEFSEYRPGLH